MKEIKNAVKEQFLHIIERQTILVMFTPKEIWIQFDTISDEIKQQTYALLRELVRQDYLTEVISSNGKKYYSETSKLENFRFDHCKFKATEILDFLHKSFFNQFNCLSFTQSKLYMPASKLNRRFNLLRRFLYTQDKILKHFILPNTCST